jgi:hypothetical protein
MRKHFFFGNAAKVISFSSCLAGKMVRKNVMTPIRNTRNIGDFTRWKRHDAYQKAFARLLRDLQTQ